MSWMVVLFFSDGPQMPIKIEGSLDVMVGFVKALPSISIKDRGAPVFAQVTLIASDARTISYGYNSDGIWGRL